MCFPDFSPLRERMGAEDGAEEVCWEDDLGKLSRITE
jgi:hypothetical protein